MSTTGDSPKGRGVRNTPLLAVCAASLMALAGCAGDMVGSLLGGLLGGVGGSSGSLTVVAPDGPVRVGQQRQIQVVASGDVSANNVTGWHTSGSGGTIGSDGTFTAVGIGRCTVWAAYEVPSTDPNLPARAATTNRVTFDVWPWGPSGG